MGQFPSSESATPTSSHAQDDRTYWPDCLLEYDPEVHSNDNEEAQETKALSQKKQKDAPSSSIKSHYPPRSTRPTNTTQTSVLAAGTAISTSGSFQRVSRA
jgi:hypothetical protein